MFKLNSHSHINVKVELYTDLTDLRSDITAKTLVIFGPYSSNHVEVCGALVPTCMGNPLKLRRVAAVVP
jgi:hypothetical protein